MPNYIPPQTSLPNKDSRPNIAGLPAPLPGDPRRQAVYSIQGTVYQAWWSIDAWLRLASPNEAIYLEGAEDFDIVKSDIAITVQVKKHASSISLGSEKAHEALANFWTLSSKDHDRVILFHYLTTSSIATEQDASFDGLTGIEAWRAAQTNPELTVKVASYLRKKLPETNSLRDFLATATPAAIQERLIRRFHWLTEQPDIEAVKRSVNDRLCVLLSNMGRSVSLSSSAQKHLESHFWEVVVKPSPTERCLTQAELLRQVEAATTAYLPIPIDQLPGLIGTAPPPGLNLLLLLTEKAPKPPDPLLKRPSLTQRLGAMVKQRRTVLLTGTVYKGKTTLAQLVASALCPEAWWINVTERRPVEVGTIFLALAGRIESGNSPNLVVIDDLDVSSAAHRVYKGSLDLVLHRANATGRSVLLTAQGASSNSAIIQDFDNIELLDVPELSRAETATLCQEYGCPESLTEMWASLVIGTTSGHPKLVQVRIGELASRGWPKPGPNDLTASSSALTSVRQSVRQLLSESVPGPVADFVYMVSECSLLIHRTIAIRLAEGIDGIAAAGDILDNLTGKWLERVEGNWFRATALLKGAASEVWSPEKRMQVHIRIHDAIRGKGTLDPWEAAALLFHAFIAHDKARLIHTAFQLQLIKDDEVEHAAQSKLLWLPLVALEAGQSITDNSGADVILRQLQFRVASALDSDTLPHICERWIDDVQKISDLEAQSMMAGMMWFSLGFSQSLKVPLKHRLRAIASIETLPSELQDLHRMSARALLGGPETIEAGIPPTAATTQMMFLFTNRSIRDSASLEQLLRWLDEDATELLRGQFDTLLEWPITQAFGAFIQGAWAATHEETSDWGPWIRLLEKIDDYAKRRASPRFGREAAKARAIILTEYLERSNEALIVLDQAVQDFGPSPVLLEQRANVFSYKQDDDRVLDIWAQLTSDPATKATLDVFAYRRAGISAARLKRWNDAEQIFRDAIASIPPCQFEHTKFGLQLDAALVASLKNNHSKASEILAEAVLALPPEAAIEGDLRWDAVHRIAVEVCKTIENFFWKHEKFDPRIKAGDASSPVLKSPKIEPGQAARYELMRVQVLHLATTFGVDLPSIPKALEQLERSRYVYVRWLAAEARLALAYAKGAGDGFIRSLIVFERVYTDLSSKRGTLTPLEPDEGPASDLTIHPEQWFGLLVAGIICGSSDLLLNLNKWLEESIQAVGIDAPLTNAVRMLIDGASGEADDLESKLHNTGIPATVRCGAATRLLCTEQSASKRLQIQAFLTSALVSDGSFARQELVNLHAARKFAAAWPSLAHNRFQFSCPRTTVPKLLHAVDEVMAGTSTLKGLLQAAADAVGEPLGNFMERVL
jgi:tetratricopeptide (TPR) repeat protein